MLESLFLESCSAWCLFCSFDHFDWINWCSLYFLDLILREASINKLCGGDMHCCLYIKKKYEKMWLFYWEMLSLHTRGRKRRAQSEDTHSTSPKNPWDTWDSAELGEDLLWSDSRCQELSLFLLWRMTTANRVWLGNTTCVPGMEACSHEDGCTSSGQTVDKKMSLPQELTVQRERETHIWTNICYHSKQVDMSVILKPGKRFCSCQWRTQKEKHLSNPSTGRLEKGNWGNEEHSSQFVDD